MARRWQPSRRARSQDQCRQARLLEFSRGRPCGFERAGSPISYHVLSPNNSAHAHRDRRGRHVHRFRGLSRRWTAGDVQIAIQSAIARERDPGRAQAGSRAAQSRSDPRLDGSDQRAAGAQGCTHGAGNDGGFRRCDSYRAAEPEGAVQPDAALEGPDHSAQDVLWSAGTRLVRRHCRGEAAAERAGALETAVASVAICFLHAYRTPENEKQAAEALQGLGYLCCSHDVCPEFREYERSSTTLINAYVGPLMDRYLGELENASRQPISIMQSNGGFMSTREARRHAIRTVLSGPAGGVIGALETGRLAG